MEKLDLTSLNITNENVRKIAEIFPNCVTETNNGKTQEVDFDALKQELSGSIIEGHKERYALNWPGKRQAQLLANTPTTNTLRPSKEESVNFDTTENLYIEGDNLEVLKILQESYLNKIKMIYIDPPYNTGKDFVYKDNFTRDSGEELLESGQIDVEGGRLVANLDSNGRYHSDWLSMMYPRLKLARNLLKEDGVIFVSIDDNEIHNLKKMCDEIFGENNFIAQMIVKSNPGGRDYGGIALTHEYILIYSKQTGGELNLTEDKDKKFKYFDEISGFDDRELRNRNIKFNKDNRPNLCYPFYVNPNSKDENDLYELSLDKLDDWIEVYPLVSQGVQTVWRWGKPKALEELNVNLKGKKKQDGSFMIIEKYRSNLKRERSILDEKAYRNERGSLAIKEVFENQRPFDYPKSDVLIKTLLELGTNNDEIILDFFSGSATTANSIMKLNSEDNGNRKFIMVQLPEIIDEKSEAYKAGYKTISEIGKERIRRAGKKIVEESAKKEIDIGFRVLKVDESNMKDVYFSAYNTSQKDLLGLSNNIKEDRTEEDLFFMVLLNWGIELSVKVEARDIAGKKVYFADEDFIAASFENNLDENFVKALIDEKPRKVVFKDSGFANDSVKVNIEQILKQANIEAKVI